MFALIENGRVAAIYETLPQMHPAMRWVDISATSPRPAIGWIYDSAAETFSPPGRTPTAVDLCSQIDTAADAARRAVAGDPLRATEYEKAATEAQVFKDAGYPADAVPRTVAAWAIGGRTAQQAADSILAEAAQYNEALYLIRETRLPAKEMVRQAMAAGNTELAQDIADETIAAIQAAVAGVGNAEG